MRARPRARRAIDLVAEVQDALGRETSITGVELAGSRARGTHTQLSDWDFAVEAPSFEAAAAALPELVEPLHPLSRQWDRLSPFPTYMLMLRGPVKVDFLFLDRPNPPAPPWEPSAETLRGIDDHFWDWILWLASKEWRAGEFFPTQLPLLHDHLLGPLGVAEVPDGVDSALAAYLERRAALEKKFGVEVPRALEREVRPVVEGRARQGGG